MAEVLSLTVSRSGLDAKIDGLKALAGPDKDKFLKAQGPGVVAFVKETFATSGSNAGVNWPAVPRGGEPLRDTGELMRSFAAAVDGGRLVVQPGGTPQLYAGVQQRGDKILPTHNKFAWLPGGPYISIPLSGKVSERRTFSLKDYPGWKARIIPGLGWCAAIPAGEETYTDKGGLQRTRKTWKPIAGLRKSAKIKPRPFLFWSSPLIEEVQHVGRVYVQMRWKGEIPS